MRGLFITFEGPDGGGKTTQLHYVQQMLEQRQYSVLTTREPGGTEVSDQIRHILLNPDNQHLKGETEVLLYAASRAQHVSQKIRPALAEGYIVLCDRFIDASLAYQGAGLGFGMKQVQHINDFATGGLLPHRTYLLDVSVETGLRRLQSRNHTEFKQSLDRIEQRKRAYHQQVREAFVQLAQREERIVRLDGEQDSELIREQIARDIHQLLQDWQEGCVT